MRAEIDLRLIPVIENSHPLRLGQPGGFGQWCVRVGHQRCQERAVKPGEAFGSLSVEQIGVVAEHSFNRAIVFLQNHFQIGLADALFDGERFRL